MVRFYDSRSSESPLSSTDLAARVDGTCDWTYQWGDLATPAGAVYFELRCGLEPPDAGTALAWFDDLALIEWEPWQAADSPLKIPAPNNCRYLQVRRAGTGAGSGLVRFLQTTYDRVVATGVGDGGGPAPRGRLSNHPNPFNPRTTIDLVLPGDGTPVPVALEIYDLRGRRVASVFEGDLAGGQRYGFTWDGRDDRGRNLAAGLYFCRAGTGATAQVLKLTLVR
ncbi:MAG: FlgD immunoglobulin-like domain containing protein, partial [bacterium]|nr:FlgD immunoglobulin-like domain containing protein [bacterium]